MKNIYEIFEEFEKAESRKEKVEVLQKNNSWALQSVLQGIFDPNIQFVFNKPVEYKTPDSPPGMSYTSIHHELGRVYIFQKNHPRVDPALTQQRKEHILIQILESLEAKESKVFMNMLLKKHDVKGLTYKIVNEAFPNLLP